MPRKTWWQAFTPQPIKSWKRRCQDLPGICAYLPAVENVGYAGREFTIEKAVCILRRPGRKENSGCRHPDAVDMVGRGHQQGLFKNRSGPTGSASHRRIDPAAAVDLLAGAAASPGAAPASGFSADEAEKLGQQGEKVILVRTRLLPMIFMVLSCLRAFDFQEA